VNYVDCMSSTSSSHSILPVTDAASPKIPAINRAGQNK
jgi:hypothetical protein